MRVLAAAGFALLLIPAPASAAVLPPAPSGAVADSAQILSADEARAVDEAASAIERESGVRVRVLTIADGSGESPKDLAVRALNTWSVGRRSVLLLIEMSPRQLYLQPGTDLASVFDEPTSAGICSRLVAPRMRSGDRAGAVLAALGAIRLRIAGDASAAPAAPAVGASAAGGPAAGAPASFNPPRSRSGMARLFALGLALLAVPLALVARVLFQRKCPSCSTRMKSTRRVVMMPTTLSSGQGEKHFLCPSCGNSFVEIYTIARLSSASSWNNDNWTDGSGSGFSGGSDAGGGGSSDGSGGGGSSW